MKEILIGGNLPSLPDDLRSRLEAVFFDIQEHLIETETIPSSGTILADKRGNRHMLTEMDSVYVDMAFCVSGRIQQILRSGNFSKNKYAFDAWHWPSDEPGTVGCRGNGENYRILGKYVDYD